MTKTLQKKRKKTLVDAEVQGGILRKIAVHWAMFFLCNAMALMIWIRLFEQPDADWGQTLADTFRRFLPFFVITIALIPAFVWDTMKLTNRFAGPILRLRNAMAEINAGRSIAPIKFRSNDFWQELAPSFNQLVGRLNESGNRGDDDRSAGSTQSPS